MVTPLMRAFLPWLLIFSLLAGLHVRAVTLDHSDMEICSHSPASCCHEGVDLHVPAVPGEHDHECPADHHHDSCCCSHALTLACEFDDACTLMPSKSSLFGMRHQSVKIPNGPFLISEKPPLI